jgi:hypothetical protein
MSRHFLHILLLFNHPNNIKWSPSLLHYLISSNLL